ncbi:uncharacterized protein LOC122264013 [Penaeus japonicus]|uniref:uncharacterized protein LOC122264013 n=1 Tax=Penaeus japonicus TaxID=27405 RepID=UPI001C70C3BB|nr:uncharacterized protein LOC122264013 [Penaeus japonicus]
MSALLTHAAAATSVSSSLSPSAVFMGPSPFRRHHKLLLYLLIALPWMTTGTKGVQVHSVLVPQPGISGRDAQLECRWAAGTKGFYSVRWYKDGEQFYSYIPQNTPEKVDHNLPGVSVFLSTSDENVVTLRKIDLSSEGTYRCEVMSEAPTFETSFGSANLTVVHMPQKPQITGLQKTYTEGDTLRINCTVRDSRPPAVISFHVNGRQVHPESGRVIELPPGMGGMGGVGGGGGDDPYALSTTTSQLILPLGKRHLNGITVECQGEVLNLAVKESVFAYVVRQSSTFSFFNAGVPRVSPPTFILVVISAALSYLLNT